MKTEVVVAGAGAAIAENEEAMDNNNKIWPLAEKITECILDHQNDAAQENCWRTSMKRDMVNSFREQREAIAEQREASEKSFHTQREESNKAIERLDSRFDMQREAIDKQRETIDEVHQLVKNFAKQG